MAIEVVLLDNIEKLGKVGDTVKVANGYARNYLFPRDLAAHASGVVLKQIDARRAKVAAAHEAEVVVANELAAKINETSITIPMQAGEDDKLFGSVTVTEIHDLLEKDGIVVDRRKIAVGEAIKTLGVHEVSVKVHAEVSATLKVWVVKA
ncbi:50S ribosomal protein L9 [Lentisphaera profundi]|uniref:Large ribosomal subunit protein bL9 n=1 Tax=Lentisphaera profundi TaxID=1658616 RepID=A0ABY7VVU8_9BACT|nr:50S ribosomal protein L9 [Lentisphaera profundi]WDE98026.1 50S ribosomal protein L9 [Lentisphaera profundi]